MNISDKEVEKEDDDREGDKDDKDEDEDDEENENDELNWKVIKKLEIWNTHVERPIGNTKQKKELKTGLVQLCSLAYIMVPSLMEADKYLSEQILKKEFSAIIMLLDSKGEMINCDELGGLVFLEGFGEVWEKQIDDSEQKKKALGELQK
ncbi:hypothetical protein ACFX13_015687 [Malus domestica]